MLLKKFLIESKDVTKSSRLWNMISSILVAFQTVVLLIIITRFIDKNAAGVYIIGNTYANLFLAIGKLGMRGFQVSDVNVEYSFNEYKCSRQISCILMIMISIGYILYSFFSRDYSSYKMLVLMIICFYKVPDAFEDVYHGEYQRNGRLDVASKALAFRMIVTIGSIIILLAVTRDLMISFGIATIITFLVMFLTLRLTKEVILRVNTICSLGNLRDQLNINKIKSLIFTTLPLAIVSFLIIYINSCPRISIDKYLSSGEQSIFGYISMPFFIVEMLVMFLLNPVYYKLSCMWNEDKLMEFRRNLIGFSLLNIVITMLCVIMTMFLGVPVLSKLYNTDLQNYKVDLIILIICGGMYSFASLLYWFMVIMRKQKMILLSYLFVSLVGTIISDFTVKKGGIRGASLLYLLLLSLLVVIFIIEFIVSFSARKRSLDNKKCTEDFQS